MKSYLALLLLCSGMYSFASDAEGDNEQAAEVVIVGVSDPYDMILLEALQQGGVPDSILMLLSQRLNQGAVNAERFGAVLMTLGYAQDAINRQHRHIVAQGKKLKKQGRRLKKQKQALQILVGKDSPADNLRKRPRVKK